MNFDLFAGGRLKPHPDNPAGIGEFHRIAQQIAHHLREPVGVAVDRHRPIRGVELQLDAAFLEQKSMVVDGLSGQLPQFHGLTLQLELVAGQPGDVEQIVDQPG